jgi:hypothetical protein
VFCCSVKDNDSSEDDDKEKRAKKVQNHFVVGPDGVIAFIDGDDINSLAKEAGAVSGPVGADADQAIARVGGDEPNLAGGVADTIFAGEVANTHISGEVAATVVAHADPVVAGEVVNTLIDGEVAPTLVVPALVATPLVAGVVASVDNVADLTVGMINDPKHDQFLDHLYQQYNKKKGICATAATMQAFLKQHGHPYGDYDKNKVKSIKRDEWYEVMKSLAS